MSIYAIMFYGLAAVIVAATALAITRRNLMHTIVYLVLSFIGTALLFYLLGAPFLAVLEVVIYAGAIMVLFLFIVVMLNIDFAALRSGFTRNMPFGLLVALVSLGRHHLAAVFGAGTALSLAIAAGLPLAAPRLTVVPLLLAAGALTGAAFPAIAQRLAPTDARGGAGRGFAADEAGAACGALLVGLVAIPWAGMPAVAGGLALLTGVTAATLWLAGRTGARGGGGT